MTELKCESFLLLRYLYVKFRTDRSDYFFPSRIRGILFVRRRLKFQAMYDGVARSTNASRGEAAES